MLFYLSLVFFSLLLLLFVLKNVPLKYFIVAFVFYIIFCATFRSSNIGADHQTYIEWFKIISQQGDAYFSEKGYVLFNYLLSRITPSEYILNFGVVTLLLVSVYIYLKRELKEYKYIVIALVAFVLNPYMYVQSTFNILRQGCATAIILFSIPYLQKKKYFVYSLFVLLAMTFHKVSVITIILIIFDKIDWSKRKLFIMLLICIPLGYFMNSYIVTFFAQILNYNQYTNCEPSLFNNIFYFLMLFLYLMLIIQNYDKLHYDNQSKWYLDLYIICLILQFILVKNDLAYRSFIIVDVVSIPAIPFIFKSIDFSIQNFDSSLLVRNASFYKILLLAYYFCFFIGYFTFLYLTHNSYYVPFTLF